MGVDNFTIHTDGVIERGQDLQPVIYNILEVGSHKISPLAAYKAQRKCFEIAKKEREIDYKEYVERLQLDHFPMEFKKCEYGRRIIILLFLLIPSLILGISSFAVGVAFVVDYGFDDSESITYGLIGIFFLVLSCLEIRRITNLVKRIKSYNDK